MRTVEPRAAADLLRPVRFRLQPVCLLHEQPWRGWSARPNGSRHPSQARARACRQTQQSRRTPTAALGSPWLAN
jgi:hypothetical protein